MLQEKRKELLLDLYEAFGFEPFGWSEAFSRSSLGSKASFSRGLSQLTEKGFVVESDGKYQVNSEATTVFLVNNRP